MAAPIPDVPECVGHTTDAMCHQCNGSHAHEWDDAGDTGSIVTTPAVAVALFRDLMASRLTPIPGDPDDAAYCAGWAEALAGLTGMDLACWCPPGQPCHADVLLELANPGTLVPHPPELAGPTP